MTKEDTTSLTIAKNKGIEAVVNKLFTTKTPKQFIKSRPGPGGRSITYVEVGYVISVLNNAFGPFWEWKITDKQVGDKQVWVQGELTIKNQQGTSITKTGFGGSAIKISTTTKEPINLANDLKAASSDAIKKAASLFGIACDVFYKEMDILEEAPELIDEVSDGDKFVKTQVMNKYFAVASSRGFSAEEAKLKVKNFFKVDHMEQLALGQLEKAISLMETRYQVVGYGQKPSPVTTKVVEVVAEPVVNEDDFIESPDNSIIQNPEILDIDAIDEDMSRVQKVFGGAIAS